MIFFIAQFLLLLKSDSVFINASKSCTNGPYYVDFLFGHHGMYEGIGMVAPRMSFGLFISELFGLKYILDPLWFKSEHFMNFSSLFNYENSDCNWHELNQATLDNTVQIVNISTFGRKKPDTDLHYSYPSMDLVTVAEHDSKYGMDMNFISTFCRKYVFDGYSGAFNFSEVDITQWLDGGHTIPDLFKAINSQPVENQKTVVYRLMVEYHHYHYSHSATCLQDNSFANSFFSRKKFDIEKGVERFVLQKNILTISYQFRWGDKGHENDVEHPSADTGNRPMHEAIEVLQQILKGSHSIIGGNENYIIYFLSELRMTQYGAVPVGNASDFDAIVNAFPPGKVVLRLNKEEANMDIDIMASADVLLIGTSTFQTFIKQIASPDTVKISTPYYEVGKRQVMWDKIRENDEAEFSKFNYALCPRRRIGWLNHRCIDAGFSR
jgi:hypothetical protein